ncbi:hypothetical protein NQ314_016075, partial [Rhamnusium bicolor]
INEKKLFRYPLKHLFLIDKKNYINLLELITPFSILPMSEVVIACFEISSVSLYQPYKIGENLNLRKQENGESSVDEPYFFQDFPNVYTLIQYLNATFTFRIFDSYGYLNKTTGQFNGLVQDLYEERGHISGTCLILSEERHRMVEFIKSFGYWSTKAKFILKKPSLSYIENIYYMTFTNKVWIASLVVLVIFAVVLYILLNWEANYL